jgi:O-antigen/teichoic acid export membrane protein
LFSKSPVVLHRLKDFKPLESPVSFTFISLGEKLLPLVLLPIFINDVGVNDYGMLFLFVTLNNILSPLLNCGFTAFFTSRFYKLKGEQRSILLGNYLFLQVIPLFVLSGVLILITSFTSLWSLSLNELWVFIVLTPISQNLFTVVKEVFQIKINVLTYLILVGTAMISEIGLSIYFLKYLDLGWASRLYAMGSTYVGILIIALILLRKEITFGKSGVTILKEWWSFGTPLIIHRVAGLTMGLGDRLIVDTILGHYYLGLYTVSQQVSAPISMFANAIKSGWNPWFYKNSGESGFQDKKRKLKKSLTIGMIALWIIFILVIPLVYDFVIKDVAFDLIRPFVYLISIAFIFQTLYFMEVPNLMIQNKTRKLARITFVAGMVIVIGNLTLTHYFELMASCVLFLIAWAAQFYFVKRASMNIDASLQLS